MQRRVAAIYVAFFLVVGASAYSVMAVASAPTVEIPGKKLQQNDSFRVGGQQYTVSQLQASSGTLTYTNQSYRYTATLANNSTVDYQNGTYRVLIRNVSNPSRFTLREELNVSAMLANDSAVYNDTFTRNGTRYVTYRQNETNVPLDEYLPAPQTYRVSEGDRFRYQGNRTRVANVSKAQATLAWTAPREISLQLSEGSNVTLANGEQYFAHFNAQGGNVSNVVLSKTSQHYDEYQNDLARQAYFHERMSGLWGVIILSGLTVTLLVVLALMPVKG